MGVRLRLSSREMAAPARPLLAAILLLGAALAVQGRRHARYLLTSSNQRELLKEAGNEIDHGPGYTSQHKQHQWQKTGHKGHAWANKFKGGLKKRRFGHPGQHQPAEAGLTASHQEEKHPKVIDTDEEEEHAEAKQEDGQDVQEDAGEAEAAEEEREAREAAEEKEAASPLKCFLYSTRLRFKQ